MTTVYRITPEDRERYAARRRLAALRASLPEGDDAPRSTPPAAPAAAVREAA